MVTTDAIEFRNLETPLVGSTYEKRVCQYHQHSHTKANKTSAEQEIIKRQDNYPSVKVTGLYQFNRFLQMILIFKYEQSVPDFKLNNKIRTAASGVKNKNLDESVHLSIKNNILNYHSAIEYKSLIDQLYILILNRETKIDELNDLTDINFETEWIRMDRALSKILAIEKSDPTTSSNTNFKFDKSKFYKNYNCLICGKTSHLTTKCYSFQKLPNLNIR
ncbi:uncharacterized protein KGF55_000010 [Candida pseudojiufengensis]|uniref:uncharacterized protein n=1 Tax=Candida pseudojiufengensis TaxID=497109 RepID=UPI002224C831|nr:uncharacterized protein KGF55_000010 [Candida pseudojiufengensis]KAI5968163.1 hypothetical protein KGF55_000010 [Candida pseudojiufengensis]